MDLTGKTIVIGVTGSIAAYKMADLTSRLVKQGCNVHVIMTKNAANFIHPITFETLTSHKCLIDTFDRNFEFQVEHVSLAKQADVMLIAPASANVIGKMANGIADDMLTTTYLAMKCPILVAPAMNTRMFENPIVQDNIEKLRKYGCQMISPASGHLACGDTGSGKLADLDTIYAHLEYALTDKKDLYGKNILVTAGPTQEALDPVRYLTNHSSGKMGYAVAKAAANRGANVTLISGQTVLDTPLFVKKVPVVSAEDMYQAVKEQIVGQDIVVMSAAVADYRPSQYTSEKIKKKDGDMSIPLERTTDILGYLGSLDKKPFLCGFAMETEHLLERAKQKLMKKHLNMIVANNLKDAGAGFQGDTNKITIVTKDVEKSLPVMLKEDVAEEILDAIVEMGE